MICVSSFNVFQMIEDGNKILPKMVATFTDPLDALTFAEIEFVNDSKFNFMVTCVTPIYLVSNEMAH